MRFTFRSDDRMVITIPLGSLREVRDGQLMPDRFTCVFRDVYKVFLRGHPKALGVLHISACTSLFGHVTGQLQYNHKIITGHITLKAHPYLICANYVHTFY